MAKDKKGLEKTKTNVMRILESAGILYHTMEYEVDENDLSGVHVAEQLGQDPDMIFKTLVLKGDKGGYYVCCIPVAAELDLKKVAKAVGAKKVEMIPMKELLPVTGYIRGGCSPIGMKKQFPTYIEETAILFDEIAVSGGIRGEQIFVKPDDLCVLVGGTFVNLTRT